MAKTFEKALVAVAKGSWAVIRNAELHQPQRQLLPPKWSDKPLLKGYQKEKPPLGWPLAPPTPSAPGHIPEIRQRDPSTASSPTRSSSAEKVPARSRHRSSSATARS